MLIGNLPFAVSHLGHPQSGIDWTHAVVGVFGRAVAVGAMVPAWRGGSERGARRAGAVVFADNTDAFRHTFTLEGTDIDVELPSSRGARVQIDVEPGEYALFCAVPGHDFMTGTVRVR